MRRELPGSSPGQSIGTVERACGVMGTRDLVHGPIAGSSPVKSIEQIASTFVNSLRKPTLLKVDDSQVEPE